MDEDLEPRLRQLELQVRYLSERTGIPLPDFRAAGGSSLPPEIQQMIAKGELLQAIKAYRDLTGCDLATAKKVVESYH